MEPIRLNQVFVPGRYPAYTYNPRTGRDLEGSLRDEIDQGGAIVTVSGLTKTGKTVLIDSVLRDRSPIRIDGSGISHIDDFWRKVGDRMGLFTSVSVTSSKADGISSGGTFEVSAKVAKANLSLSGSETGTYQRTSSVDRPAAGSAVDALLSTDRALVVDDFHFIPRVVQRDIVRGLKDLVYKGLTAVFVATSHRALDAALAEENMEGRTGIVEIEPWSREELAFIARKGFSVLNLVDDNEIITNRLIDEAFGSPHLLQQFGYKLCRLNQVEHSDHPPITLVAPDDWADFFRRQASPLARKWFQRLSRGPQERRPRNSWERAGGGRADTYGLVCEALAIEAVSATDIPTDRIKARIAGIVSTDGPALHQVTRALQNMSVIAKRPLDEELPFEDTELIMDDGTFVEPDRQAVIELANSGPSSIVSVPDPFFRFFLKWGVEF